jgi:hypothetical protein
MGSLVARAGLGLPRSGCQHLGTSPTVGVRGGNKRPRGRRKAAFGAQTPIADTQGEPSGPDVPDPGETSAADAEVRGVGFCAHEIAFVLSVPDVCIVYDKDHEALLV